MRYYAEWLDGEYSLLAPRRQDHFDLMQRSLRLHAVFGSTIVLSDTQLIDRNNPIPSLFLEGQFRAFINSHPAFLALVGDPLAGAVDRDFAIAMRGIGRLIDQANKSPDSYDTALTLMGERLLHDGVFDPHKYLSAKSRTSGRIGRILKKFPAYKRELVGVLHALNHFSRPPLQQTTLPADKIAEQYDTLLDNVRGKLDLITEIHAARIDRILEVQEKLPPESRGKRAAIRRVLAKGKWQEETWDPESRRLYLDVVHAWNCTIRRRICPEAGSLFESHDDLPLSRYEGVVSETIGWFRSVSRDAVARLPSRLQRVLSWDPLRSNWTEISQIADKTRKSAAALQDCLRSGARDDKAAALVEHASHIADHLVGVRVVDISCSPRS